VLDGDPAFRPVRRRDGYLPLEDLGLIGDGTAAALCARASALGLLPEQIDPSTGEFSGNFPQASSHIGVIAAGVTLARAAEPVASRGRQGS
jgi:hypothetical protein